MKLSEMLRNHGSDKVVHHQYADVYDEVLTPYKDSAKNILELGILNGNSMRAWHEFFPNATIYGVDNEAHRLISGDRFKSYLIDTKERDRFINIGKELPMFDVIIDDASHQAVEQVFALSCLWNNLAVGGVYIIEDLYRAEYMDLFDGYGCQNVTKYDLTHLKGKHDDRLVIINKG